MQTATVSKSLTRSAERHTTGAHFTSLADMRKIVEPTIERPWYDSIEQANTKKDLVALRKKLLNYRVLDPACGCGNFLSVAYQELVRIELVLLGKIYTKFPKTSPKEVPVKPLLSLRQLHGIDNNPFAVEMAKVTLLMAKQLAMREASESEISEQIGLDLDADVALPLDNLDANFQCDDALFCGWPKANAIIGNPPYQSKNKMQEEYGRAYLNRVRDEYPDVSGHADYCVYWFRRAQDELDPGGRAGLVGTKTITQNKSREGGLDYIVEKGSTM